MKSPDLGAVPALILAAGKSTRLGALAQGLPKPLMQLHGHSLLEWNLLWLAAAGVRNVWINVHHRADAVQDHVRDGSRFGIDVHYSHEPELLGTAGAWKKLSEHFPHASLVIYGDNFMRFDLTSFVARHAAYGAPASVALFDPARHVNTGAAGGHAQMDDSGRVSQFVEGAQVEKQPYVNAGAYVLDASIDTFIPAGFSDFGRDVLPVLARRGDLRGHVLEPEAFCLGCDTPERFATAESLIRTGQVTA